MGGIEALSIPRGFVRILSMQLPEYPWPPNMPKGVEIVFTNLVRILCQGFDSIKDCFIIVN